MTVTFRYPYARVGSAGESGSVARRWKSTDPYPKGATFGELLGWHLSVWGTNPRANKDTRDRPWVLRNFAAALRIGLPEGNDENGPEKNLRNWRNDIYQPDPKEDHRIFEVLFGGNPELADWNDDLQKALDTAREAKRRQAARGLNTSVTETREIPRPTAYFIGRNEDVERLADALASAEHSSALLIQGGPGIGKTELTKAIAHHDAVAARFGERRYFVPLENGASAENMQHAIMRAIGSEPQHGFAAMLNTLRGEQTLFVLDNLETPWQSQYAQTEEVLAELAAIPGVAVLASFRGREAVGGLRWLFHEVHALPPEQASELFAAIAGALVQHDTHLNHFITALGGIPLAVILVAHRAHGRASLAPLWREWQKIGGELAQRPDVAPDRLTSLDRSIEFSLRSPRVTEPAMRLFAFLGSLPSGLASAGVEALLGDGGFAAAERLCHVALASEHGDRIDLLPPIRDHARRLYPLNDADTQRCSAYFMGLVAELETVFGTAEGQGMLPRLAVEFANIEACLRTCAESCHDRNFKNSVNGFAQLAIFGVQPTSVFAELSARYRAVSDHESEGLCLRAEGNITHAQADYVKAYAFFSGAKKKFAQCDSLWGQADCLQRMGDIAFARNEVTAATAHLDEAQSLFASIQHTFGEANVLRSKGDIFAHLGQYTAAFESYTEAGQKHERIGYAHGAAHCMSSLSGLAINCGEYDIAGEAAENALALYEPIGDLRAQSMCKRHLAQVASYKLDHARADQLYEEARTISENIADAEGEAMTLLGMGASALCQGRTEAALSLYQAAHERFMSIGSVRGRARCLVGYGTVAWAEARWNDAINWLTSATQIFEESLDVGAAANCRERLGEICSSLYDQTSEQQYYEAAMRHLKAARDICTTMGHAGWIAQCEARIASLISAHSLRAD